MCAFRFPDSTKSYWRDSLKFGAYPEVNEDMTFDVGIVGGGITGITLAYLLSEYDLDVCVIDARTLLSGTTGNTTAKVTIQHGLIYDELILNYGLEYTRKYYHANERAKQFIHDTILKLNIDCDYKEASAVLYTMESDNNTKLEREMEAYDKLGITAKLNQQTELPFNVANALQIDGQAHFHPLKYLTRLIDHALENGVSFFENSPAVAIDYSKKPIIVLKNGHRIVCDYVVEASHYPFFDGQQLFPLKMYAERSYALLAKTERTVDDMYLSIDDEVRSIRPVNVNGETYMIFAGENHRTGVSNIKMNDRFEKLARFANEHFHLEHIEHRWSAQDYTTLDKLPYIGTITKEKDNVFVATGFRKWGMTNGTNAAIMLKNLILHEKDEYMDIFATYRKMTFDPAVKKLVSFNVEVAKHLITGKFDAFNEKVESLRAGEAMITMHNGQRIGVYKDEDGELYAVDTTCTHLGCELEWNDAEKSWDCPCHGSRFSYEGDVLNGPAVKNLKKRTDVIEKYLLVKQ